VALLAQPGGEQVGLGGLARSLAALEREDRGQALAGWSAVAAAPLIAHRPEVIFHLAAIVSGEAEAEFDKGYRINLDGTRYLIDAIRAVGGGYKPRLVFTSSIAVFGAPFPEKIGDEFFHTPLTSYGTQKAVDELLQRDAVLDHGEFLAVFGDADAGARRHP